MESGNHYSGDLSLLRDESQIRIGCGPANNAAIEALLTRQKGNAAHAAGQPSGLGAAHPAARSERVPQGIQNPTESQTNLRYRRWSISVFGFKLHHACLVHERFCVSLSQATE